MQTERYLLQVKGLPGRAVQGEIPVWVLLADKSPRYSGRIFARVEIQAVTVRMVRLEYLTLLMAQVAPVVALAGCMLIAMYM